MRDFKSLKVWQRAHRLTLDVYTVTRAFPKEERFGLTSQVRRSASSIPSNIAEGCGRCSDAELARFSTMASGSTSETEYHLLLARDLGYLAGPDHERLTNQAVEVRKMLASLIRATRSG